MPALLTAIVITCGAIKGPLEPLACRAQVYHGAYSELVTCAATAQEMARTFEAAVVADGRMTRTRSYGECVSAADEPEVVSYLPQFMKTKMGAITVAVVHYDLRDGRAVERKVAAKKAVKGAAI